MHEDLSKYNEDDVKIVKFLWENQGKNVNIDDVVKNLCVSKFDFMRIFRRFNALHKEQVKKPIQQSLF